MKSIELKGINIQWPWSEMLICGKKTIETRKYPLPEKLKNVPLAVIETPGKRKDFKARIIGVIIFTDSKKYSNEKVWKADFDKHLVEPNDPQFKFKKEIPKYGWIVGSFHSLKKPITPPKTRGIVYANGCMIPIQEIVSIL